MSLLLLWLGIGIAEDEGEVCKATASDAATLNLVLGDEMVVKALIDCALALDVELDDAGTLDAELDDAGTLDVELDDAVTLEVIIDDDP